MTKTNRTQDSALSAKVIKTRNNLKKQHHRYIVKKRKMKTILENKKNSKKGNQNRAVTSTSDTIPSSNTEVNLQRLLNKDANELSKLVSCVHARGWSLLTLPEELIRQADSCLMATDQFLNTTEEHKLKYSFAPHFGYFSNWSKQGFRLLTGQYLTSNRMPLPDSSMSVLGTTMDSLCKEILSSCGQALFSTTQEELASRIPLLQSNSNGVSGRKAEIKNFVGYGMLDIVHYGNKFVMKPFLNVSEHEDPGLFSISFKSTAPGLEMLDPISEQWIAIEPNQAVLWFGSMAREISGGKLPAGVHRVRVHNQPRMTLWYEVCVESQVDLPIRTTGEFSKTIQGTSETMVVQVKVFGTMRQYRVSKDARVHHLYKEIEKEDGIPPTKRLPNFKYNNQCLVNSTYLRDIQIVPNEVIHFDTSVVRRIY